MVDHRNELAKPIAKDILTKLNTDQVINDDNQPFGDGHSAIKIVDCLESVVS
jgi:hypothetical protein